MTDDTKNTVRPTADGSTLTRIMRPATGARSCASLPTNCSTWSPNTGTWSIKSERR
jgi:hypothetical protein